MTPDEESRAAWAAVPWETSLWQIGLAEDLAARLYLAGWKTVGDVDRTLLAYGEGDLQTKAGLRPAEKCAVIRRVFLWCRTRFHENLNRLRGL